MFRFLSQVFFIGDIPLAFKFFVSLFLRLVKLVCGQRTVTLLYDKSPQSRYDNDWVHVSVEQAVASCLEPAQEKHDLRHLQIAVIANDELCHLRYLRSGDFFANSSELREIRELVYKPFLRSAVSVEQIDVPQCRCFSEVALVGIVRYDHRFVNVVKVKKCLLGFRQIYCASLLPLVLRRLPQRLRTR